MNDFSVEGLNSNELKENNKNKRRKWNTKSEKSLALFFSFWVKVTRKIARTSVNTHPGLSIFKENR